MFDYPTMRFLPFQLRETALFHRAYIYLSNYASESGSTSLG